jgi:hypothetical protein
MPPSPTELEAAARRLVRHARTAGTLRCPSTLHCSRPANAFRSALTPRLVREKLEEAFGLDEGALHEHRRMIRRATTETAVRLFSCSPLLARSSILTRRAG